MKDEVTNEEKSLSLSQRVELMKSVVLIFFTFFLLLQIV